MANGVGLVGGLGLRAAYDALRNQRKEAAFNQERERNEAQRAFQREIDLRRIAETEAEGTAGRSARDTSLGYELRRILNAEKQQDFANAGTTADRAFTEAERARAADERAQADALIAQTQNNATRRALALTRLGVPADRGLFLTPEERGAESGTAAGAAFDAGGRRIAKETAQIEGDQAVRVTGARQQGRTLTPGQELVGTMQMQKQWDTLSKDARDMGNAARRMSTAWQEIQKGDAGMVPAAAESIQVLFQKILDPGSVVREGEFTRSLLTQPIMSRMRGFVDRIAKGGTGIPVEELAPYVQIAQQFARAAQDDMKPIRSRFERTATANGLDPSLIFGDDLMVTDVPRGEPSPSESATGPQRLVFDPATGTLKPKGGG